MNGQKASSVLRLHADRAVTYYSAHFDPQITYAKKLPNIADTVMKRSRPHWASTAEKYMIRETNKKFIYHFDHQIFFCQTLGLDPWIANFDDHVEVMSIAFSKMDVTRMKRLGFRVSIQLPFEMSHLEMCDLLFGSYLVQREELTAIYGIWTMSSSSFTATTRESRARRPSPRRPLSSRKRHSFRRRTWTNSSSRNSLTPASRTTMSESRRNACT